MSLIKYTRPQIGNFGIFFDIDGVILRGKSLIPAAKDAISKLMNRDQTEFLVPILFCTNGFGLKKVKAEILSKLLEIEISPQQLVMSQSPLEMMTSYHDKCCLISGPEHDGGSIQVAKNLGFTNIVTIDEVRAAFPYLDWVDRNRWAKNDVINDPNFPKIDAVVLLGEPIRWETNLQLIIDVIISNGRPAEKSSNCDDVIKQLPVIAVNLDLQWMAKAATPRFGHGAFLLCLESLYKKMTGLDLEYEALIGKPSIVTYLYSKDLLEKSARKMGAESMKRIYAIGDNPLTDVYGSNIFNNFLAEEKKSEKTFNTDDVSIEQCSSILVCTGVYQPEDDVMNDRKSPITSVDHGHRDLPFDSQLTTADYVVHDVNDAIEKICKIENWHPRD